MKTIQPYQFMHLTEIFDQLLHTYQTVSDMKTIAAVQAITIDRIYQTLPMAKVDLEDLVSFALDRQMTRNSLEKQLLVFKENVLPFVQPSDKQIEKVFRKVKKLQRPDFESFDLRDHTYIGWNDPGTQKKFLLYYNDERLEGIYGDLSTKVVKGYCSICHHEANVALFTAISKKGSEGRYTKKGNYICVDSKACNCQLHHREDLDEFLRQIK